MRIILLGPPGSGKGTQGDMLSRRYQFPKVSTGDILRRAVRERTRLGLEAETLMNRGLLVDDNLVVELVAERIAADDCRRGYILDGFPRNVGQARSLDKLEPGRAERALEIEVGAEVLAERLGSRLVCSGCQAVYNLKGRAPRREGRCDACGGRLVRRPDDAPEVIAERLKVYQKEMEPLRELYRMKKVYQSVDGRGSLEDVYLRLSSYIDAALAEAEGLKEGAGR